MKDYLNELVSHRNNRPKIMLVDDQVINLKVLHELFKKDCEVFVATNGEQAITQCQANLPDLILLDVEMPGMNGFEVCRQLKSLASTRDIPVVFLTSHHTDQDQIEAFEAGAVDIVGKPFNSVIVLARVGAQLTLKLQTDLLKSIAFIDGLTGISNRRQFDKESAKLWQQAKRNQQPISLLMIDVDHFKLFNDSQGHATGDLCLQAIAECLKMSLKRPLDLAARFGGEEFVCVLPDTNFDGVRHITRRLLDAVRTLGIAHPSSPSKEKLVSVSIGAVTIVPQAEDELTTFIEQADKQLYQAKASGRACVSAIDLRITEAGLSGA